MWTGTTAGGSSTSSVMGRSGSLSTRPCRGTTPWRRPAGSTTKIVKNSSTCDAWRRMDARAAPAVRAEETATISRVMIPPAVSGG